MCFIIADRGGALKRLHRSNPLGICCISFKEKLGFQDHRGINPDCPQRGPYEASEGTYPGRGQEKLGLDKLILVK